MIKFFRHIRESLVMNNKPSQYFKYAIGEIVLVVVGILIALQINNWNEQRKELKKEQQILLSLKEEFQQNIMELGFDHDINLSCLKAITALLNFDSNGEFETQFLDSLVGQAYNFATFDARLGVINDLSSSGNLELISDSKLRYALNQWTGELNDYKEDVIIRRDYWIHNVSPLTNTFLPIRNTDYFQDRKDYKRALVLKPKVVSKTNYVNFMTNLEVDGMLFDYYINQSFVTTNEEVIMEFLQSTLKRIESNINHD